MQYYHVAGGVSTCAAFTPLGEPTVTQSPIKSIVDAHVRNKWPKAHRKVANIGQDLPWDLKVASKIHHWGIEKAKGCPRGSGGTPLSAKMHKTSSNTSANIAMFEIAGKQQLFPVN